MINRMFVLLVLAGFALLLWPLVQPGPPPDSISALGTRYIAESVDSLQTQNVVTAVVVTFRGLDTLGEVAVLFAASAAVGLVMSRRNHFFEFEADVTGSERCRRDRQTPSEILRIAAAVLRPLLLLFGVYIFVHGHLTPGGGFQGGVVIAAALLLTILADEDHRFSHRVLSAIESLSGAAYVIVAVLGLVLAAGFLDPSFLPLGTAGTLLSAGAIPLIYSLIGLKVGTELTGVVDNLRRSGKEHSS